MPRGGKRQGAGRKKADGPVRAARAMAKKKVLQILASDKSPLDYMLGVMRGDLAFDPIRFAAAKSAAPYVHPKLQAIEHSGEIVSKHEQMLDELDQIVNRKQNPVDELDQLERDVVH